MRLALRYTMARHGQPHRARCGSPLKPFNFRRWPPHARCMDSTPSLQGCASGPARCMRSTLRSRATMAGRVISLPVPRRPGARFTVSTTQGSGKSRGPRSIKAWSRWSMRKPRHVTLGDVLDALPEQALLLVLDGVTDPHNLGACLRSADAFGAHAVVVPKDRAVGVNATVAKAASGAADTVPVVTVTNLARALRDMKEHGIWILGADAGGEDIFDAELPVDPSRGCWVPRARACAA